MSFYPSFSLHLEYQPFEATAFALDPSDACVLKIGEPGPGSMQPLTLFFPASKLDQVQRIADALNEIGKPSAASNPLAA